MTGGVPVGSPGEREPRDEIRMSERELLEAVNRFTEDDPATVDDFLLIEAALDFKPHWHMQKEAHEAGRKALSRLRAVLAQHEVSR